MKFDGYRAQIAISGPEVVVYTRNGHKAPAAIGPYSQGRVLGDLLFVSGQIGLDPTTGKLQEGAVAQLTQSLTNIAAIAAAAGTSLAKTVKTTVLVTDLGQWTELNAEYSRLMPKPFPARSTYQVSALPMSADVEIEAIIQL